MKKILSVVLILCLLSGISLAYGAHITDFTDVSPSHWFYSNVKAVVENGMFNGMSATEFGPDYHMTRGMFVTVLGRYAGESAEIPQPPDPDRTYGKITRTDVNLRSGPTTSSDKLATLSINTRVEILDTVTGSDDESYKWYKILWNALEGYIREDLMAPLEAGELGGDVLSDVSADSYYAPYVYWAINKGIAEKTGADTFSPEVNITREDICMMLYNYAAYRNYRLDPLTGAISFTDYSSIAPSRAAAVTALQRVNVVTGYPDGSFMPKASATRAEVCAFLVRFLDAISYKPDTSPSLDAGGNYIWGAQMPQGIAMNASYFDDACFIGHSLVVGMSNYFGAAAADFYCFNGSNVQSILSYSAFDTGVADADDPSTNRRGTLEEALKANNYGKVYIMLGTNEVGSAEYHKNVFYNGMSKIVDLVRSTQPNAPIYIISLTPVSESYSFSSESLNRDNIVFFNGALKQLCADKHCYYLNVFDLLADSRGYLPAGSTFDGVHITAYQYTVMKNYFLNHTA